jgi:hypothetical protein
MNTTYDRLALLVLGLMVGVALAAPTPTAQTKGQDQTALTREQGACERSDQVPCERSEQPSTGLGVGP